MGWAVQVKAGQLTKALMIKLYPKLRLDNLSKAECTVHVHLCVTELKQLTMHNTKAQTILF